MSAPTSDRFELAILFAVEKRGLFIRPRLLGSPKEDRDGAIPRSGR